MLFWNGCQFRHYFTKESNKIAKVLRRSLAFKKVKRKCNCEFFEIIHGQLVRTSSPYQLIDMQMCTKPEAPYHQIYQNRADPLSHTVLICVSTTRVHAT